MLLAVCSDKKLMADYAADMRSKTGMKTLFGRKNIKKDNTEGKVSISKIMLTRLPSDITSISQYVLDRLVGLSLQMSL